MRDLLCGVAVLLACVQTACGQTACGQADASAVKIHLQAPPEWRGEEIRLPPGFAPDMSWKGIEEVRFAPGMFDAKAEDFFSYVFVFYLPDAKEPDSKELQKELLKYYRGLATAVAKGKGGVDAKSFRLTLNPPGKPDQDAKPAGDSQKEILSLRGVMQWTEPFATMKPQTLHLEIQSGKCGGRTARFLVVAVSPKTPEQAKPLWSTMRRILKTVEFRSPAD